MTEIKPWLSDEDYAKAVGQLRLNVAGAINDWIGDVHYGYRESVHVVTDIIIRLAEDFSLRTRGVDKPIDYDRVKNGSKRRRSKATD